MSLIPQPYQSISKIAALVAVIGGLWWANQHFIVKPATDRVNAAWQQKWDARDKADAAATLEQERINRDKEQALQAFADEEQRKADAARSDLARRLAASRVSAERLQQGVSAAISALNGGAAAGATPGSTTGRNTGLLLSDLYRSINTRAEKLAEEADRRRNAGLICERLYNNARDAAK